MTEIADDDFETETRARPIGICVDYDDTFTTNREAWTAVIEFLRAQGANVFCITLRFPDCPINDFPGQVYYAAGQKKWEFAEENGIDVNIWIDDWPEVIGTDPKRKGLEPPQFKLRRDRLARGVA